MCNISDISDISDIIKNYLKYIFVDYFYLYDTNDDKNNDNQKENEDINSYYKEIPNNIIKYKSDDKYIEKNIEIELNSFSNYSYNKDNIIIIINKN